MKTDDDFLNIQKENMEILGFWDETYKASLIRVLESRYKKEIIKIWCISDLVMNGEKVLVKWNKRHMPLSEDEMLKRYGE